MLMFLDLDLSAILQILRPSWRTTFSYSVYHCLYLTTVHHTLWSKIKSKIQLKRCWNVYGILKHTGTLTVNHIHLSALLSTWDCHIAQWRLQVTWYSMLYWSNNTLKTSSYWFARMICLTLVAPDGMIQLSDSWTIFMSCSLTKQVSFFSSLKSEFLF